MAHVSQERYSSLVDVKLRNTLVTRDNIIFNNRYESDPKAGKVKVPVRDTEVEVKAYNKQTGSTSYFDLFNCKLFMNGQPSVLYDSYNKNMDWKILKIIRNQIRKCKFFFVFLQYLCRF